MAGYEVGVQMRLYDVRDLEALLRGRFEVDVDIALRVDHGSDPCRADQIRSVRKAAEEEIFDQQRFHVVSRVLFPKQYKKRVLV